MSLFVFIHLYLINLPLCKKYLMKFVNMVMLVNIDKCTVDFNTLIDLLDKDGEELGMKIHTMHEDIFDAMHKI